MILYLLLFILMFGVLLLSRLIMKFDGFLHIFVDDCTHMTWLYMLKNKSDIGCIFHIFYHMIHTQFKSFINIFHFYNGREFVNIAPFTLFQDYEILYKTTCSQTLEQNSIAQHNNMHILKTSLAFSLCWLSSTVILVWNYYIYSVPLEQNAFLSFGFQDSHRYLSSSYLCICSPSSHFINLQMCKHMFISIRHDIVNQILVLLNASFLVSLLIKKDVIVIIHLKVESFLLWMLYLWNSISMFSLISMFPLFRVHILSHMNNRGALFHLRQHTL